MPTRDTAWPTGTPCWVDYGTTDVEAAKAFYTSVLGWTYTGGQPEYGGYLTCVTKDRPAAGMGPQQDPANPPSWTTYFATDDADRTAGRITEAGGSVLVPPMEVGPMGRMVIAMDPQGSPFGLWEAGQNIGVNIYNEAGALVWNEAAMEDADAARTFYGAVFDFSFDELPDSGGYTTFATDGEPLGGLSAHQPGSPKGWTTCFSVSSTDDAVSAVEKGGGKVVTAPTDSEFGRFAVLQDPWGAAFSVMEGMSDESPSE